MAIVDASGQVLGRLCSLLAKRLLDGDDVVVVNAEKAIITGSRDSILLEYREKRAIGSQRKGPYFPKGAERIFRRTLRGMLPYQRRRGREALKRFRAYVGTPSEMVAAEVTKVEAGPSDVTTTYITLEELSKLLGAGR